jgi:hypothetical protein
MKAIRRVDGLVTSDEEERKLKLECWIGKLGEAAKAQAGSR